MSLQAPYMESSISSTLDTLAQILKLSQEFNFLAPDHARIRRVFFDVVDRPKHEESQVISRPMFLLANRYEDYRSISKAANGWFECSGSIELIIEIEIGFLKTKFPTETRTTEELLQCWRNHVGMLESQIKCLAYDQSNNPEHQLDIRGVSLLSFGRNSEADAKSKGAYIGATFKIDWGPNQ